MYTQIQYIYIYILYIHLASMFFWFIFILQGAPARSWVFTFICYFPRSLKSQLCVIEPQLWWMFPFHPGFIFHTSGHPRRDRWALLGNPSEGPRHCWSDVETPMLFVISVRSSRLTLLNADFDFELFEFRTSEPKEYERTKTWAGLCLCSNPSCYSYLTAQFGNRVTDETDRPLSIPQTICKWWVTGLV
jgi:hypothetical protein